MNIQAQNIDWKKIFSGDISAYKKYNIKTASLIKEGNEINRIEIFSYKNEIVISNKNKVSHLLYDSQNRLKRVISENLELKITYFENETIESVERESKSNNGTGIEILKNYRPYSDNIRTIYYNKYFLDTKTGSYNQNKKRFVFNQKDTLCSFHENTFENGGYFRKYFNGTKASKRINENGFEKDSTYKSNNKEYQYSFLRNKDRDIITKKEDSVYTENYIKGNIESRTVQYNGNLYEENFYFPNDIKRKKYFYLKASDNRYILWEIKSTYNNGKTKSKYPAKRYYALINGKLIRNKRQFANEVLISTCGAVSNDKTYNNIDIIYDIYSSSVLFSSTVEKRFLDNLEYSDVLNDKIEIIYSKIGTEVLPNEENHFGENFWLGNLSLDQNFHKHLINFVCRENYNIEFKTEDGKTFTRKFTENPEDLSIILNIFGTSE